MDVLTLLRGVFETLEVLRQDLGRVLHVIELPLVLLVLPGYFLPYLSQETLLVSETS